MKKITSLLTGMLIAMLSILISAPDVEAQAQNIYYGNNGRHRKARPGHRHKRVVRDNTYNYDYDSYDEQAEKDSSDNDAVFFYGGPGIPLNRPDGYIVQRKVLWVVGISYVIPKSPVSIGVDASGTYKNYQMLDPDIIDYDVDIVGINAVLGLGVMRKTSPASKFFAGTGVAAFIGAGMVDGRFGQQTAVTWGGYGQMNMNFGSSGSLIPALFFQFRLTGMSIPDYYEYYRHPAVGSLHAGLRFAIK